jgi:uncharacterized protein
MSDRITSVSRIPIAIILNGDIRIEGELIRYLAPLTVKRIVNNLPISQLINNFQNKFLYVKFDLFIGAEKPINKFKKGDLAFSPISNSICIFIEDYNLNQQFTHIGHIDIENMHGLLKTKTGDILTIKKAN